MNFKSKTGKIHYQITFPLNLLTNSEISTVKLEHWFILDFRLFLIEGAAELNTFVVFFIEIEVKKYLMES